ncbi:MAG: hypothetical protein AAF492_17860 [Verrucomicrobiota bacterium]
MGDLKSRKLILLKGFLFLFTGVSAFLLLLLDHPDLRTLVLLLIAVWSFSRFYYFAFYVIEKYVDGQYRFAGLIAFFQYLRKNGKRKTG